METLEPILAAHPFFHGLKPEYLSLITGCASNVRFKADEVIYKEGDAANYFYLIRQGKVGLQIHAPQKGYITIQTIGEGDILGWSWIVPPYKTRFTAMTFEETRAVALDGKCLRGKCDDDYRLGYEFYKRFTDIIVQRLQATRLQLLDVYGAHH